MNLIVLNRHYLTGLFLARSRFQLENEFIFRPKHDPDKPPPAQPGDHIVVISMFVGAIVLATAATIFALITWIISPYFGLAAGAIVGGIIGTLVGDRIKKAVLRRRQRKIDRTGS
jgi:hypothetical protein